MAGLSLDRVDRARGGEGVVGVEQWAELCSEHFVRGVSIRALVARTGLSRNTVRAALRAAEPPKYRRESVGSKLDPFKDEIHRLLKNDAELTGQRIRELIAPLGFEGGKTIVDDYLREVRPFFVDQRTFQRTIYRPARSASSMSGNRRPRSRSAMARPVRPTSLSRAWATRAPLRAR